MHHHGDRHEALNVNERRTMRPAWQSARWGRCQRQHQRWRSDSHCWNLWRRPAGEQREDATLTRIMINKSSLEIRDDRHRPGPLCMPECPSWVHQLQPSQPSWCRRIWPVKELKFSHHIKLLHKCSLNVSKSGVIQNSYHLPLKKTKPMINLNTSSSLPFL